MYERLNETNSRSQLTHEPCHEDWIIEYICIHTYANRKIAKSKKPIINNCIDPQSFRILPKVIKWIGCSFLLITLYFSILSISFQFCAQDKIYYLFSFGMLIIVQSFTSIHRIHSINITIKMGLFIFLGRSLIFEIKLQWFYYVRV